MKSFKTFGLMGLGLILFSAGCAQRPDAELSSAEGLLKNAVSAEAGTYAPDELKAAQELMGSVTAEIKAQDEAFVLSRSYDKALEMLVDVKAKASAAEEAAKANKEKVRQECEQLKAAAEAAIATAEEMVAKAPKGKGTKADLEAIQGDLSGLKTSLAGAAGSYDSGQFMTARDEFQSVVTQAEAISAEIETAILKKGRR